MKVKKSLLSEFDIQDCILPVIHTLNCLNCILKFRFHGIGWKAIEGIVILGNFIQRFAWLSSYVVEEIHVEHQKAHADFDRIEGHCVSCGIYGGIVFISTEARVIFQYPKRISIKVFLEISFLNVFPLLVSDQQKWQKLSQSRYTLKKSQE